MMTEIKILGERSIQMDDWCIALWDTLPSGILHSLFSQICHANLLVISYVGEEL